MRHVRTHHRRADDDARWHRTAGAPHLRLDEDQIRAVYRFMYQYVGARSDAEDLTERACSDTLRAARDMADMAGANERTGEHTLDDLLWRTARAVVAEHLRWFYDSPAATAEVTTSDGHADAPTRVRDLLAELPAEERDFLARRFLADDSLDEAASALRLTRSDALALQWRALIHAAHITREEARCSPC